jgi:hypothetical protein
VSRDQLVQTYLEGQIDRPTFVRRLRAAGMSLTAALALAAAFAPVSEAGVSAQHNETLVVAASREDQIDDPTFVHQLRAMGVSVIAALALAAAFAPVSEAGVTAQHNETLVVI